MPLPQYVLPFALLLMCMIMSSTSFRGGFRFCQRNTVVDLEATHMRYSSPQLLQGMSATDVEEEIDEEDEALFREVAEAYLTTKFEACDREEVILASILLPSSPQL